MNFFKKIAERISPRAPETRSLPVSSLSGSFGHERVINARTAENLSTVLACVSAISSALASLPAYTYRVEGSSRTEDRSHPFARLIHVGPNERQTWPDFIEWLLAATLLRGNGLAEIRTDRTGRIVALVPIPWEYVSVQLLPSGRLAYDVVETVGFYGATGRQRRLLEGEVLHLRDRSDDGLLGRSRLSRAAAVLSAAFSVQDFAGSLYENSAKPSGVITFDKPMTADAVKRAATLWTEQYSGSRNAGRTVFLDSAAKWNQITINPEDAELLASRRFTGEELARLFQVPPPIVGDLSHGTFTNSETLIRFFAQSTLAGWCRKLEAEIHRAVFTESERETHAFEIDLSGLLRGDPETRWKSHEIALKNRVLTPNEVRETEGWNPRAGGDDFTDRTEGAA